MSLNLEEATAKVAEHLWRDSNPECPISRCDAWDYCKAQARDLMQVVAPLFGEFTEVTAELEQAHSLIYDLRAELERARPVLDAARALVGEVRDDDAGDESEWGSGPYLTLWHDLAHALETLDACPSCGPGGCAGHTRKLSEVERKLPVCAECGHRHRWGGECADHSWTDACPYDADANCEAAEGLSSADTTAVERG